MLVSNRGGSLSLSADLVTGQLWTERNSTYITLVYTNSDIICKENFDVVTVL